MHKRLAHANVAIQARALQHDSDPRAQLPGTASRVKSQDRDLAAGALTVALEDLHRRGLARPVRPQKAENLAAADLELDAPHRLEVSVGLPEAADLDCRVCHFSDDVKRGPWECARGLKGEYSYVA